MATIYYDLVGQHKAFIKKVQNNYSFTIYRNMRTLFADTGFETFGEAKKALDEYFSDDYLDEEYRYYVRELIYGFDLVSSKGFKTIRELQNYLLDLQEDNDVSYSFGGVRNIKVELLKTPHLLFTDESVVYDMFEA